VKAWLVLLPIALLSSGGCRRSTERIAFVDLPAAANIREGTAVRFQNIDIGVVKKVTLRRSGVRATLLIQRPDAPLQTNDHVAVQPNGFFGDQAVDIIPATTEGRPLRDGDTLRAAPPDSVSASRDALARALVHEFTERMLRSDTTKR